MLFVVCVINGTAKNIKNASVNMFSFGLYQILVQALWIPSLQVAYLMYPDIIK